MIDVRDVMKYNYTDGYKLYKKAFLDEKRAIFGEKEVKVGLSLIVCGIPNIIRNALEYADSTEQFLLVIPAIRENIFDVLRTKSLQKITYSYNDLHAFIVN